MEAINSRRRSQSIRLDSDSQNESPLLCNITTPAWPSNVLSSLKRWFSQCLGKRAQRLSRLHQQHQHRRSRSTSDAKARKLEESGWKKPYGDCEPLIEVEEGEEVDALEKEKKEGLKMVFPKHAASSFLRTATSRGMREANQIL